MEKEDYVTEKKEDYDIEEGIILTLDTDVNDNFYQTQRSDDDVTETIVVTENPDVNNEVEEDSFSFIEAGYVCSVCGCTYKRKSSLQQHIKRKHKSYRIVRNDTVNCLLCACSFPTRQNILLHLYEAHKIIVDHEHLQFENVEKFYEWKKYLERTTITVFSKKTTNNNESYSHTKFHCHRNGHFKSNANRERKRKFKLQGTKKLGGFCPAEIALIVYKTSGLCKVSYVKTHLGHNVCDENELAHIYLTNEERLKIASEIALGVPFNEILINNVRSLECASNAPIPLRLLNRKDLHNISRDFSIKGKHWVAPEDPLNVQNFIANNRDSILYYKEKGRADDSFSTLQPDDLVIVMMTETQAEQLIQFGGKAIAVNGTRCVVRDLLLHTVMVIDDHHEGIAAAFAISNRNDDLLSTIFFDCIREKIGAIETRTFISGTRLNYFNGWNAVMGGNVDCKLFCQWHVNESWKKHLKKINNVAKRNSMGNHLYTLSTCLDENLFQIGMDDLMNNSDPDLSDFLDYFKMRYFKSPENWAYCYRTNAGVNTNAHIESFSRALKYFYRKLPEIKDLSSCLELLKSYLTLKRNEFRREEIKGKFSQILRDINETHDRFITSETWVANVEHVPETGWYVSVSHVDSAFSTVYLVKKSNEYCNEYCKLICDKCDCCLFEYHCSCPDYDINRIMCEHIHHLCTFLKSSSSPSRLYYERSLENFLTTPMTNEEHEEIRKAINGSRIVVKKHELITMLENLVKSAETDDDFEIIKSQLRNCYKLLRNKKLKRSELMASSESI